MNKLKLSLSGTEILKRTGGLYLVLSTAVAQLLVTPVGIVLAALILYYNAEFSFRQLAQLALFTGAVILLRNILLLTEQYVSHQAAVRRLDAFKRGETLERQSTEATLAWKQITHLAWRHLFITLGSLYGLVLVLVAIYARYVLDANNDQMIYLVLASIVSGLSLALLEILILERFLAPARILLLPSNLEAQVAGATALTIRNKLFIVLFALITISVLLIAPIGYHQTTIVLYREIGSLKVLQDLQVQSLIAALFALFVGFGLSQLLASSVTQPINQIIQAFQEVERGNLAIRMPVTATDEVGQLAIYFNNMIARLEELQSYLERRVQERTAQLQATIEVSRAVTSLLEPGEVIRQVVQLISEQFGYYYVAIFLIDPSGQWAELKEATGEAGKILKERGHRLEIGGKSMVGDAIARKIPRIALDVGQEAVRFDNPLLPHTRSEIALPLMIGERVIGALDVQSTQEAAFDEDNIQILQSMANQVAIAVENARLFQESQQRLEELQTIQRQYLSEAWSQFVEEERQGEYVFGEPQELMPAIEIPLTLRNETLGVIQVARQEDWSEEEKSLLEAIATQAALALENARLLEESQKMATIQRLIAEINAKVWSSIGIEGVLQTAVRELGRALEASSATIEIKPEAQRE
ncbi:MAG: GAF domain-containing protein [Anaerolineales bacterium]|nr:GAF domain-containing protein [Anaerolineales bacterium]